MYLLAMDFESVCFQASVLLIYYSKHVEPHGNEHSISTKYPLKNSASARKNQTDLLTRSTLELLKCLQYLPFLNLDDDAKFPKIILCMILQLCLDSAMPDENKAFVLLRPYLKE